MLTQKEIEMLRQSSVSDERILQVVQNALNLQHLTVPTVTPPKTSFAGGTNFCPNSDFSYSELAATVAGTLPSDPAANNQEVHRVFTQVYSPSAPSPVSTTRVAATGAASVPLWDKVNGVISLGWDGGAGDNYDIAIKFTNNWLVNNRKRYIRCALALADDTPLPSGIKLYAGYWVKRLDMTEGWVDGSDFELTYHSDTVGTQHFKYKVVAKTDSGFTISSKELDVPDAPDVVDDAHPIRIQYGAAAGFIEFTTYRLNVATGVVDKIAWDRNDSRLFAYDTGQSLGVQPDGFPTAAVELYRAYQEVAVDATDIAVQKTFHNFTIVIPANLDNSNIAVEGTYLRIGVIGECAMNGQILIDTILDSDTYHVWSPSPFDNYESPPSTTMTTAPPTAGGGGGDPPIGAGSCLYDQHDFKLSDGSWSKIKDTKADTRLYNGQFGNNISRFVKGFTSQYYSVEFDCGLVMLTSPSHRFARTFTDSSGLPVTQLKAGDKLIGGNRDGHCYLTVKEVTIVNGEPISVRSPQFDTRSQDKFYAAGDSTTGWYVFNHNSKPLDVLVV